jgi:RNA recognition motif-containing protein
LGNLASDRTSEREIRDMFLRYGNIKEVVIRKGFGFIQFDSSEAAQKAIKAENGRTFRGYKLDVSLATGEPRKTDKSRDAPRTELPRPDPRPLPRPEPRREYQPRSRDNEPRGRGVELSRNSRERRDRKRYRSRDWTDDRATKRAHIERSTFVPHMRAVHSCHTCAQSSVAYWTTLRCSVPSRKICAWRLNA